jgi:hypothetical protein
MARIGLYFTQSTRVACPHFLMVPHRLSGDEIAVEDADLFLQSFAQLAGALLSDPADTRYQDALHEVSKRLATEFDITDAELVGRSPSSYTVTYRQGGEWKHVDYPADLVEDFG